MKYNENYRKTWRTTLLALLFLTINAAAVSAQNLKEMISTFDTTKGTQHITQANKIMDFLVGEGFGDDLHFDKTTPADTINMAIWYYTAEYLHHQQDFDGCIDNAQKALPLTEGNGDWTWRSETLNLLNISFFQKTNWQAAIEYSQQLYDWDKQFADPDRLSSTLNTLAGIYLATHQPKEALGYIEEALRQNQKTGNTTRQAVILGMTSEVYEDMGDYQKALDFGQQAFDLSTAQGDSIHAAIHLLQIGAAEVSLERLGPARLHVEQAVEILRYTDNIKSLGIGYMLLGKIATLQHQTDKAVNYIKAANKIFVNIGNLYNQCSALHALYDALYDSNPQKAKQYHDQFSKLQDSLYHSNISQIVNKYHAQYRNSVLSEQNQQARRANRYILLTAIGIAFLLLAAIAFLIYAIRLKSRSNQTLSDLQKARELFFTNITHEFRTPLTIILGMGRQLKKQATQDKDIQQAANMIEQEGQQLLGLVNQLLDISKLKANSSTPNQVHGNIVAYLSMLLENYRSFAHTKNIELVFAPRENHVDMDFVPDYIQKIVRNLVSNAIKFTSKGGHVFITTKAESDKTFVLTIADNGPGISRKAQRHIFEPFFQGNTDSQNIGTGIGLSLVKQIVDTIDGTIHVYSSPGKGSAFVIQLPIRNLVTESLDNHQTTTTEEQLSAGTTEGMNGGVVSNTPDIALMQDEELQSNSAPERLRILIIEDNSNVALYMGQQLEKDYDISYAANGQIGLERAETIIPDLIITDLMMPEMDGIEVCRRIRANDAIAHIPIIIITAKTTEEDRIRGIEAGADAYLYKPFNAEELRVRIEKLLEQRRSLREKFSKAEDGSIDIDDSLSEADRKFIGKLTDLVYSMMGRGETDVETIASHLAMSVSVLRRKVTTITGQTPAAYIMQIRMANAKRLLDSHPEWSVSDVATRCGFNDNTHFTHTFRKYFGISPTQYAHRAK